MQCPVLIKQRQEPYMPCDNQDLDELIAHLPKLHEGAEKWIKVLEEETTGKLLVIGGIKALLAKCLGVSKINYIPGGVQLTIQKWMAPHLTNIGPRYG